MRLLLSILIAIVLGVSAHGAAGSQEPPPYALVSSNATVTFVTNTLQHILDLSVATSGGATNGIQQLNGFGTNTTFNGATVHNGAHVDTNFVGWQTFTNGIRDTTGATLLPGGVFSNNVAFPFQAGSFQPITDPVDPTTNAISGAGSLNGVYQYAWTLYGGGGETLPSPTSTISPANNSVLVTIPGPFRGEGGRKIYRTVAGGAQLKMLYDFGIGDAGRAWHKNQFLDDVADGALGTNAPAVNTSEIGEFEVAKSVKTFRTPYSAGTSGDLTLLTQKQDTSGSLAADIYGQVLIRDILGAPIITYKYGTSGYQMSLQHQSMLAGGTQSAVFLIQPGGSTEIWPDLTDTNIWGLRVYGANGIRSDGVIYVGGTSTLNTPVNIGVPGLTDSSLNVNSLAIGGLGRHANIRATAFDPGNNALFWGGSNTNYQNSLGWSSGAQEPDILFFAYESTNSNAQARFGSLNAPLRLHVPAPAGNIVFQGSGSSTADSDITWLSMFTVFNQGGVVIGTNTSDPGILNLAVDGTLHVAKGATVVGTSTLAKPVNVAAPTTATDSSLNVAAEGSFGRHANIRATGNGNTGDNSLFWGSNNPDNLASLSYESGTAEANILFYSYGSSNVNNEAYAGTANAPVKIQAMNTSGNLVFSTAAAGALDADITWKTNLTLFGGSNGGVRVGYGSSNPGNGWLETTGGLIVDSGGASISGGVDTSTVIVTNSLNMQNVAASKVIVSDSLRNLTNTVLTTGTIPVASSTAISDSPVYVTSVTNANVIGQHTSDNSIATNGYNVPTIGKGITIKAGTNGKLSSTAETLSGGTVVVNNTSITANSKVFLQPTTVSPVSGVLAVTAKSVGASFTVTSSNALDTNQFSWFIVESQ